MRKEMSSFDFLQAIGDHVWPQTWGMFASFNQDPLRKRLVEKLKEHDAISQEYFIEENYGKLSASFIEFMLRVRQGLYMSPILDLVVLLLEGYDDSQEGDSEPDSQEKDSEPDPIVVTVTLDRLREVAAKLDREVITDATGFEGRIVDFLLNLITRAIWQVIVDNDREITIEPVIFRVPS